MKKVLELRNKIAIQGIENNEKIKELLILRENREKSIYLLEKKYSDDTVWNYYNNKIGKLRACNEQLQELLK